MVPANSAVTPVVSSVVEAGHVLKASPGCLLGVYTTTGAVGGFLMVFNSATIPADGVVTPIECVQAPATSTPFINYAPQPPAFYNVGIAAVFSTTGCFTKTGSATAFFHGTVQ
jgi:hypothetical protein